VDVGAGDGGWRLDGAGLVAAFTENLASSALTKSPSRNQSSAQWSPNKVGNSNKKKPSEVKKSRWERDYIGLG
jgi:hypothetical protein